MPLYKFISYLCKKFIQMKRCSKCKIKKPESDFYKNHRNCKACHKEIVVKYQEKNPLKVALSDRKHKISKKYNVSIDDYNLMFKAQKGRCAICNSNSIGRKGAKYFSIDHCHTTGKVRGLLCHNCNVILGKIKDSKEWLKNAIKYLN